MRKNLIVIILILALLLIGLNGVNLSAEEIAETSLLTLGAKTQSVYGAVGKVDYVDFKSKSRGESTIVLKTSKGETVEVSLSELKAEATILATFRKEKDKKGKEKNTLISLSIVKTAKQDEKSSKNK